MDHAAPIEADLDEALWKLHERARRERYFGVVELLPGRPRGEGPAAGDAPAQGPDEVPSRIKQFKQFYGLLRVYASKYVRCLNQSVKG